MIVDVNNASRHLPPPLVAHVILRFGMGGMENGLINLINNMSSERYRHAIISLTDSTAFSKRLLHPSPPIFCLHKPEGHSFRVYVHLWRLLRQLRPAIVHTRNLPALEFAPLATIVGSARVHGEHGRDIYDLDGTNAKYRLLRQAIKPLIHRHLTVSADLSSWLTQQIGVSPEKVSHIYNGVDVQKFCPRRGLRPPLGPLGFSTSNAFIIGAVGRMQPVKDQLTLMRAFLHLLHLSPEMREHLRLVIVGDGPLRVEAQRLAAAAGAASLVWLPGERADVPELMRAFDLFVLPSLAEGISNTILEAMASGLPVVATHVGGNAELVIPGQTGDLVTPANPITMANTILSYIFDRDKAHRYGRAGRERATTHFSIEAMVNGYLSVYDAVLQSQRRRVKLRLA